MNSARKLIIANWKMNPLSVREAKSLASEIGHVTARAKKAEVVVAPPFVFLSEIKKNPFFKLGAQDVFYETKGAYTGEISIAQLKSFGVKFIIVGHSERRALGETNEIVRKKLKLVLENRLLAVLCVGERERIGKEVFPAIVRQEIHEALHKIKKQYLQNLIIAYEPIWAIGTGKADTPKDVYEMSLLLRRELYRMYGKKVASRIKIVYGGSVDKKNSAEFVRFGEIDGLLVGGASLNSKNFAGIIKSVAEI